MKHGMRLALLSAAVLLCAAVYLYLPRDAAEQTSAPEPTAVPVLSVPPEDITALTWDYAVRTLHFQRKGGVWQYPEDEHFPVDQDSPRFTAMQNALSGLTATRYLPDAPDPSEYGLDAPTTVITVQYGNGHETTLTVGSQTPVTGEYYLQISNDPGVYLVGGALPAAFACGLFDLVQTDTVPDLSTAVEVRANGNAYRKNEQGQWCDSRNTPLDTDLTGVLTGLRYDACVDYYAERFERKDGEYGLTHGKTVRVTYGPADAPETWELIIGNDYDDNHVFVSPAGSDLAYTMEKATVDALLDP